MYDAEDRLNKVRENAANDIFAGMNSVGDMGREHGIEGELRLTFTDFTLPTPRTS